jgi:pimeloyl-ACP methyl ester carboxylesterase
MTEGQNKDERIILSYKTLGNGDEIILAFHGFGHSKEDFSMIEPFLSGKERIIAIDLFGHGEAFFPESRMKNDPISKDEWKILIEDILIREKVSKFHLMGYSLGGRMALVTFEMFKDRVKSVFLFSPDGLHKTPSFAFANESKIGRALFRAGIHNYLKVKPVVKALHDLYLVPRSKARFILRQMENPKRIEMAKYVWSALSICWPDLHKIFDNSTKDIQVIILFGKYDPLIKPSYGDVLDNFSQHNINRYILPMGHRTISREGFDLLTTEGYWPINLP